jgi:hypothetical protein
MKDISVCQAILYVNDDETRVLERRGSAADAEGLSLEAVKRRLDGGLWLAVKSAFGLRFAQLDAAQVANLAAGCPWGDDAPVEPRPRALA